MATVKKVAIFGDGYLADITDSYLRFLFPEIIIIRGKLSVKESFDHGFICLPTKRHATGSVDLRDIGYVIAQNKHHCAKNHFFVRSQLSIRATSLLNRRAHVTYFPNLHKRATDFERIMAVISKPRRRGQAVERLNKEFFAEVPYQEFEAETLELGCLMRAAMNAIQCMGFHVLNEICQANDINYHAAILCTIYAAEKHGEFTIYGADKHSGYSDWMRAVKDLSHHGKKENVLGRALFDVVDGLNEQYFADQ